MNIFKYLTASLLLIMAIGCNGGNRGSAQQNLVNKLNKSYKTARNYTDEQKQAMEERFQKEIDSLDNQIDKLKARASDLGTDARQKMDSRIEDLKMQKKSLQDQLDKLRKSSGKAWINLETHIKKSFNELKEGINKAGKELQN